MRARTITVHHFFTMELHVAVERFSAIAGVVKNMVSTKAKETKRMGGGKREAGEWARYLPRDCGGAETDLGNAVCRRRGHRLEIEKQPCEYDGRYRCSARFVRIDNFGNQDGDHVPDDEIYGQSHLALLRQPVSVQANRQVL